MRLIELIALSAGTAVLINAAAEDHVHPAHFDALDVATAGTDRVGEDVKASPATAACVDRDKACPTWTAYCSDPQVYQCNPGAPATTKGCCPKTCNNCPPPPPPPPRAKGCWSARKKGYYIKEQHGKTNECFDKKTAMAKCQAAQDCHGIATQSNVCGGKYRVTHGAQATLAFFARWKHYKLWAYTLNRSCSSKCTQSCLMSGCCCLFHNGLQEPQPKCHECTAVEGKQYDEWYQNYRKKYHRWYEKYRGRHPPRYRNKQGRLVDCNPADCAFQHTKCGLPPCRGMHTGTSKNRNPIYLKALRTSKSDSAFKYGYCPARGCGMEVNPGVTNATTTPTKENGWTSFWITLPATRFGLKQPPIYQPGFLYCYPKANKGSANGYAGSWLCPDATNCNPLQMITCSKGSITHTGLWPQPGNWDGTNTKSALLFVKSTWCIKGTCVGDGPCPMRCYTVKRGRCVEFTRKKPVMPRYLAQLKKNHIKAAYNELKAGRFGECTPEASKAARQMIAGQ